MVHKRAGILILLLLIFAIRAGVPAGFMPDFKSGGDWITICSGLDSKTIHVDESGQPDGSEASPSCPFSFLSAAISVSDPYVGETVWYRTEFFEPVLTETSVFLYELFFPGQFILKTAPPHSPDLTA